MLVLQMMYYIAELITGVYTYLLSDWITDCVFSLKHKNISQKLPKSLALKIIQEIIFTCTSKNNMIVVLGWTLTHRDPDQHTMTVRSLDLSTWFKWWRKVSEIQMYLQLEPKKVEAYSLWTSKIRRRVGSWEVPGAVWPTWCCRAYVLGGEGEVPGA